MLNVNQLVLSAIWPTAKNSSVSLCHEDGEVLATFELDAPMLGADLKRLCPEYLYVKLNKAAAFALSGPLMRTTSMQFDSSVSTVRPVVTMEDRLARLERKLTKSAEREAALRDKAKKLKKKELEDEVVETVVAPDQVEQNLGSDATADIPAGGDNGA